MKRNLTKPTNFFKNLLVSEQAKKVSRSTVEMVFRALIEPVAEMRENAFVLIKLKDRNPYENVLRRISFLMPQIYSIDKTFDFLKSAGSNPFDENSEFIIILTSRYSAIMAWDYELANALGYESNITPLYIMLNSKVVSEIAKNISEQLSPEIASLVKNYNPERRTNETLNSAVFGIINTLDNILTEFSLTEAEKNKYEIDLDVFKKYEYSFKNVNNVRHEIKNHLSIIDLYSKIIEKKISLQKDTDDRSLCINSLDVIRKSILSISQLMDDLRSNKINVQPVDLKITVNNVIYLLDEKFKQKKINIICNIPEKIIILTDEMKFQNVILNLLYNSVDAIGEDGQIEIESVCDEKFVQLFIKDNGKGINEVLSTDIFSTGYTTKPTGQGLGLGICKETMLSTGGNITLEESKNGITVFRLDIPFSK